VIEPIEMKPNLVDQTCELLNYCAKLHKRVVLAIFPLTPHQHHSSGAVKWSSQGLLQ